MEIKDYLNDMKKNTYLYNKCNSCQKQPNEFNKNEIFNYCLCCKIFLCNKCIDNHDKNHLTLKSNKITTRCQIHSNNNYSLYCLDCKCHLCKDCLKNRKYMKHNKRYIGKKKDLNLKVNVISKNKSLIKKVIMIILTINQKKKEI